jgi:hypothetical protein
MTVSIRRGVGELGGELDVIGHIRGSAALAVVGHALGKYSLRSIRACLFEAV